MVDREYMRRVLHLALKGKAVSPNPKVGALLVREGRIIGRGFHDRFGGPHAEVEAIRDAGGVDLRGSTLYVNLEPCCHYGKTPPCTDLIVRSGIGRVVIGIEDPNPQVNGKGIDRLRAAGIEVETGVLSDLCRQLNEPFIAAVKYGRPLITLKIAQTLDGKIFSPNCSKRWITGIPARASVHKIRREHDAVLVGVNTVIQDNPRLTVRHVSGNNPVRIVLDGNGRIPLTAQLWKESGKNIIVVCNPVSCKKIQNFKHMGATVWRLPGSDRFSIQDLLTALYKNGFLSVLVEGGSDVFTWFLNTCNVDKLIIFWSSRMFGEGIPAIHDCLPRTSLRFETVRWSKRGEDWMMEANRCSQV